MATIKDLVVNVQTLESREQLLVDAKEKDRINLEKVTSDLETANTSLTKVQLVAEEHRSLANHLQVTVNSLKAAPVINDAGRLGASDRDLFNKLVKRCKVVDEEVLMLEAQLVESQGFQFRENDLQNELHRKTNM
eukprot:8640236-Heterocapsa_arctica.AAC.1